MAKNRLIGLIIAVAIATFLLLFFGIGPGSSQQSSGTDQKSGQKTEASATEKGSSASGTTTAPTTTAPPRPSEDNSYRGYTLINGLPWYYQKEGVPAEKGWIDHPKTGDHLYYCLGNGQLATGWKYLEGKVWYFYQQEDVVNGRQIGALARSYTTSGKLEVPEEGCFEGDEGLALAYGIDVLNRFGWNLKAAFRYSGSLRFEQTDEYGENTKIHEVALVGFETGTGNCMVWSGTFCTMAKLLGKDCRLIWGTLVWNGVRPHAWTEIWEEDGIHVYDPRKNEGQDLAGFDVRYGQKGTYRYNEDSRIYLEW